MLIGANAEQAAYLFSTGGTLLATFTNPTPADYDYFGGSVAAVGASMVLIGASGDDTGALDAGSAYLFSTSGTLLKTFTNPAPASEDGFGYSVAAVGNDRVLIGAYQDNAGAADAGSAYLFSIDGTLLTTFPNPTPALNDNFGRSVASVGSDKVLIAAPFDSTDAQGSGSAYLFSTGGALLTTFTNPTPGISDSFGSAVAAAGSDRVLITAPGDDTGATDAGAAYLFSLPSLPAPVAGGLDPAFAPGVTGNYVSATAVQPDGKVVVVGNFSGVDGQTRKGIVRLHPDGSVESTATFNSGTGANFWTWAAAVQADGKIVIGGPFTTMGGQTRNHLARLMPNGTVESTATFNPGTGAFSPIINDAVRSVAVQADGKILLGGQFTSVNGQSRKGIARLMANGTVESTATFNPGTGASTGVAGTDATVSSVAVQADGKILIAGDFTTVNGQARKGIARLMANGTVESTATFDPGTGVSGGGGPTTQVSVMAVQADGKILIAGDFTAVNGEARNGFARLLTNGTVESTATFNPGAGATGIRSMALQADGKILLAGFAGISRIHVDGSAESTATFNPNFGTNGSPVFGVALQADGKILLAGSFTSLDGQLRNHLARLANDAAIQSLTLPDSTRVQWLRGGAAPEVEQVTFEVSTNGGASWTLLGSGTRIPGGWELTGLSVTGTGTLRARGRTSGGGNNGSSGMVESVATKSADFRITSFSVSVPPVGGSGWRIRATANGGSASANAVMELQSSDMLTGWSTLTTMTADGSGIAIFDFVDVTGGAKRFYRVRKP